GVGDLAATPTPPRTPPAAKRSVCIDDAPASEVLDALGSVPPTTPTELRRVTRASGEPASWRTSPNRSTRRLAAQTPLARSHCGKFVESRARPCHTLMVVKGWACAC